MSTGPIDQNKPQVVREMIESSKHPDESASKLVGKHSGRTVLSGEQGGKVELGQAREEMDCRQLTNDKDFSNTVINSQNQKNLQRQDSGFNEKMSDAELSELDEIRLLDQVDYSDADSVYDSDFEESGRSERGDDDSEEGDNEHDESTMPAAFNRKNALRFAIVLSPGEIELLKKNVTQQDIEFFIAKFDELKGVFFHTGDYLVEHVDEACRKIQQSFVRHSDVSHNAGQLVFWWNLLCKNIQDHLRWCKDVELKRLDATFIKRARKMESLESKRSGMYKKFMMNNNIWTRMMAGKAQKAFTRFKDRAYLPEVEQLKQDLFEKTENEKNKRIFGKCYEQFNTVLQGNVRNIPGEVDKWGRNLLLNRTFLESGLTTDDIIR